MCSSTGTTALDRLVDGVPAVQHGAGAAPQRAPPAAGRSRTAVDEVGLRHVLDGEGGLLLVGEVAEEGALGDLDGVGDLVDGRLLVPLGREQFERRAQQRVAGALLLALAQSGRRRPSPRRPLS